VSRSLPRPFKSLFPAGSCRLFEAPLRPHLASPLVHPLSPPFSPRGLFSSPWIPATSGELELPSCLRVSTKFPRLCSQRHHVHAAASMVPALAHLEGPKPAVKGGRPKHVKIIVRTTLTLGSAHLLGYPSKKASRKANSPSSGYLFPRQQLFWPLPSTRRRSRKPIARPPWPPVPRTSASRPLRSTSLARCVFRALCRARPMPTAGLATWCLRQKPRLRRHR
jgi:hypothetical protein